MMGRGRTGVGKKVMAMLRGRGKGDASNAGCGPEHWRKRPEGQSGKRGGPSQISGRRIGLHLSAKSLKTCSKTCTKISRALSTKPRDIYVLYDGEDPVPRTSKFLRQLLPFSQSERVEEYFEEEIDRDKEVIADVK
jgi:hypothetical protein